VIDSEQQQQHIDMKTNISCEQLNIVNINNDTSDNDCQHSSAQMKSICRDRDRLSDIKEETLTDLLNLVHDRDINHNEQTNKIAIEIENENINEKDSELETQLQLEIQIENEIQMENQIQSNSQTQIDIPAAAPDPVQISNEKQLQQTINLHCPVVISCEPKHELAGSLSEIITPTEVVIDREQKQLIPETIIPPIITIEQQPTLEVKTTTNNNDTSISINNFNALSTNVNSNPEPKPDPIDIALSMLDEKCSTFATNSNSILFEPGASASAGAGAGVGAGPGPGPGLADGIRNIHFHKIGYSHFGFTADKSNDKQISI
jgi:hypothetical protein